MDEVIYLLFILPGFLIFTLMKILLRRFARDADSLDKALYSLFFDVPVFLLSIIIFNSKFVAELAQKIGINYSSVNNINDILPMFSKDIKLLFCLLLIIIVSTIIVGILTYVSIIILEKLADLIRGYKISNFKTVYETYFVNIKKTIPIEIQDLNTGKIITEGFLKEASCPLEDCSEFCLVEHELYLDCKEHGLLTDLESTYINIDKGFKILIYKWGEIPDLISLHKRGELFE